MTKPKLKDEINFIKESFQRNRAWKSKNISSKYKSLMNRVFIGFLSKSRACTDFNLQKAGQTKIEFIFKEKKNLKKRDMKDF